MKISIVLSTFNGSEYITEQLDTLRNQTRPAEEVLISDDASTDDTVQIIEDYIAKYELDNWLIRKNKENQGWKNNFARLLEDATGDIIFLCDQDDIWHLDKVQKMSEIMENNEEILLLASNYTPFYLGEGVQIKLDKSVLDNSQIVYQPNFLDNFFHIRRPGCVYAVNKKIIPYFLKTRSNEDAHDAMLWRLASLLNGLYIYSYSTIDFRRHDNNATGSKERSFQKRKEQVIYYDDLLQRLGEFYEKYDLSLSNEQISILNDYILWASYRKELYEKKNLLMFFKLFKYRKLYWSFRSYVTDFIVLYMKE